MEFSDRLLERIQVLAQQQRAHNASQHEERVFYPEMMPQPGHPAFYQGQPSGPYFQNEGINGNSAQMMHPNVPPHLAMGGPYSGPTPGTVQGSYSVPMMENYHVTQMLPSGPHDGQSVPHVNNGVSFQMGPPMPNYHVLQYQHTHYSVPGSNTGPVSQGSSQHPYVNYSSPPPQQQPPPPPPMSPPPFSRVSSPGSVSQQSAAASFFTS